MRPESTPNSSEAAGRSAVGFTADDLAQIFHYPSIGHLFSSTASTDVDEFRSRMTSTRDQLEQTIRHGGRDDARKADVAVRGINVTLDFLASLEQLRSAGK